MGIPASEVGYTLATTGRGDHKVHKGHVVALEKKKQFSNSRICNNFQFLLMLKNNPELLYYMLCIW
jgi:hypothetical protein